MEELTKKEQEQFSKIKWRRVDGKYFSYFDTKLEAFRCLQEIASRYKYTDKYTNTISSLVNEYNEKGIKIYPNHLGKWLKNVFNVNIEWGKSKKYDGVRIPLRFSVDSDLFEYYNQMKNGNDRFSRTDYLNVILRHHAGLDINELIVYFDTVSVVFAIFKGECIAVYMGNLTVDEKKLVESLCIDADYSGLEYVKRKCEMLGYYCIGVDN